MRLETASTGRGVFVRWRRAAVERATSGIGRRAEANCVETAIQTLEYELMKLDR